MKKTISIIGANDKMGTAVAKELVTGPYRLLLMGNEVDKAACLEHLLTELKGIAPDAEVEVLDCLVDASWEADIIILVVAVCKEKEIAAMIKEVATGKLVIRITDAGEEAEAEELYTGLPYSKVIKVRCEPLQEVPYVPVVDGMPVRAFIELQY